MELLPAIDLHDGRAVRLVQGDFDRPSTYGDPEALARSFVAGGPGGSTWSTWTGRVRASRCTGT